MNWSKAASLAETHYGVQVERGEDNFFICPECEEPILEEDYPILKDSVNGFVCPICEELID